MDGSLKDLAKHRLEKARDDFFIATKKEAEKQVEVANEIVSLVENYLKKKID